MRLFIELPDQVNIEKLDTMDSAVQKLRLQQSLAKTPNLGMKAIEAFKENVESGYNQIQLSDGAGGGKGALESNKTGRQLLRARKSKPDPCRRISKRLSGGAPATLENVSNIAQYQDTLKQPNRSRSWKSAPPALEETSILKAQQHTNSDTEENELQIKVGADPFRIDKVSGVDPDQFYLDKAVAGVNETSVRGTRNGDDGLAEPLFQMEWEAEPDADGQILQATIVSRSETARARKRKASLKNETDTPKTGKLDALRILPSNTTSTRVRSSSGETEFMSKKAKDRTNHDIEVSSNKRGTDEGAAGSEENINAMEKLSKLNPTSKPKKGKRKSSATTVEECSRKDSIDRRNTIGTVLCIPSETLDKPSRPSLPAAKISESASKKNAKPANVKIKLVKVDADDLPPARNKKSVQNLGIKNVFDEIVANRENAPDHNEKETEVIELDMHIGGNWLKDNWVYTTAEPIDYFKDTQLLDDSIQVEGRLTRRKYKGLALPPKEDPVEFFPIVEVMENDRHQLSNLEMVHLLPITKPIVAKGGCMFNVISEYDDILTNLLIDSMFLGFTTHKLQADFEDKHSLSKHSRFVIKDGEITQLHTDLVGLIRGIGDGSVPVDGVAELITLLIFPSKDKKAAKATPDLKQKFPGLTDALDVLKASFVADVERETFEFVRYRSTY